MPKVNPRSNGIDGFLAQIAAMEKRIRRLEQSTRMSNAASRMFDGDTSANDPGTTGWALTESAAYFGDIFLRGGIIGDDALAHPISAQVFTATNAVGQNGSASFVALAAATITVPSGFSQALVHATAAAGASTNVSGGSFLEVKPNINGNEPTPLSEWIVSGTGSALTVPHAALLTGISGTITVTCYALQTTPADIVAGTVGGSIAGSVIFLR